jgi:hypothetical protein
MLEERIILARERVPRGRGHLGDALCDLDVDGVSVAGGLAASAPA